MKKGEDQGMTTKQEKHRLIIELDYATWYKLNIKARRQHATRLKPFIEQTLTKLAEQQT